MMQRHSEPLTVWGRRNSINVQKVLWTCEELEVPYQVIEAGGAFGLVNEKSFEEINPNRLVPALRDRDLVLWESNAIVRYLAARYGQGSLWPEETAARALSDRWMDWQAGTLWPVMRIIFQQLVRTPVQERDLQKVEDARQSCARLLEILERTLENSEFLGGSSLSIGDISVGVALYRWMQFPIKRENSKNIDEWYARLADRCAYQKVVMQPLS